MKGLLKTCIEKPVIAIVLSLILVVLGFAGFMKLDLRFFPELKMPVVTISTSFSGASADLMENNVTTIIENAIAGVKGVDYTSSSSSSGRSYITVMFRMGGDFEEEVSNIRDKVSGIRDKLPPDAYAPTIRVGGNDSPVISIGFLDSAKSSAEIRDYIARSVQPVLNQLQGVGGVGVMGSSDYAMRVWLDPDKMTAYGITVIDIKTALTNDNINFAAGSVQTPTRSYAIVSNARLKSSEDFGNIIIKQSSDGTVRLKDVAQVELGYLSLDVAPMRINGKEAVDITVSPLQGANPIVVAGEVRQAMKKIQANLPPGMTASINYDNSVFLKSSIDDTFLAIAEAIILVILVVFLFLGSLRASMIPIVTIPVSLLGAFGIIYLLGFSINVMSLLAMVLAIGLVVDDAIVMLENIHRHIENGESPLQAALKGSREIAMAVVSMGVTLVAVYAPIGLIQGFTAVLFQQFAFTLAGAVIISAFVALTLSPMMCSKVLLPGGHQGKFASRVDRVFEKLTGGYGKILDLLLSKRLIIVVALAVIAVAGFFLFKSLHAEFIPKEDTGIFQVNVSSPTGSNLKYTDGYTRQVEALIAKAPGVQDYITQLSSTWAHITVTLKPWGVRKQSTEEIADGLNAQFANIPGVTADAYVQDMVDYGVQGSDIDFNISTIGDYNALLDPANKFMDFLKRYPGVVQVTSSLRFDQQQYSVGINRDQAADLGISIQDLGDTVSAMMSSYHAGDVEAGGGRSYQVLIQMQKKDLGTISALNKLYVRSININPATNLAPLIPLSSLVSLTPMIGQSSLTHYNRMRAATISARLAPGYSESQAINYIEAHAPQILGHDVSYQFSGKAKQFLDSQGSMAGIVILAFIFIYLILAAQFTSFLDPLVVLISVPLSLVGGLLFLKIGGGTINLYSQIGLVTLVGMISKHGILITQFINQLREGGMEMREAIIKSASIRLRPILMTTSAMVFGTLPLVIASGPGSIGRHQIGWVIVGGLICGTFFSLIVVPVAYSYIGKYRKFNPTPKIDRQDPA